MLYACLHRLNSSVAFGFLFLSGCFNAFLCRFDILFRERLYGGERFNCTNHRRRRFLRTTPTRPADFPHISSRHRAVARSFPRVVVLVVGFFRHQSRRRGRRDSRRMMMGVLVLVVSPRSFQSSSKSSKSSSKSSSSFLSSSSSKSSKSSSKSFSLASSSAKLAFFSLFLFLYFFSQ